MRLDRLCLTILLFLVLVLVPACSFSRQPAHDLASGLLYAPPVVDSLTLAELPTQPISEQIKEEDPPEEKGQKSQIKDPIFELPEITIFGARLDDGVPEVPFNSVGSREIFGPDKVKETGSRDLNDLLQNLPAVSTRPYNGGEAAAPSFSTRGLPDDGLTEYINVLIDGVPASPLPYGWTAFSFMPITTERIHAVDYIRGGHSVRYSPNTAGGVINFITNPIPAETVGKVQTVLGSNDYSSTLLTVGGQYKETGVLATFVNRRGDGYRANGEFDQQDINIKLRFDQGDGDWFSTSFSYMEDEHQAPGGLTLDEFAADRFGNSRPDNKFDGFRSTASFVQHNEFSHNGWGEAFLNFSETGRRLDAQRPKFGTATEMSRWNDESFFASLGYRLEKEIEILGKTHTFFGGVRAHRDWIPSWKLRTDPVGAGATVKTQDAKYSLSSFSMHLDDTFELVDDLTAVLGARLEYIPKTSGRDEVSGWRYDDQFSKVLPGVGLAYEATDDLVLFGNYFESFRAPQVWGYAYTTKDNALEFEEGQNMEAGVRYKATAGLSGSVTYWQLTFDDFGVFYTGFYENLGRIESRGTDWILDWDLGEVCNPLDGLSLSGAITFQDAELKSGVNSGNDVPYAWNQKASWRGRYEIDDWKFSLGGVMVGGSYSDDANTAAASADGQLGKNGGWAVWDSQLAKSFSIGDNALVEAATGVTNLFDRDWEVHSRGGFFGGGLVAGAPRQYYLSLGLTVLF